MTSSRSPMTLYLCNRNGHYFDKRPKLPLFLIERHIFFFNFFITKFLYRVYISRKTPLVDPRGATDLCPPGVQILSFWSHFWQKMKIICEICTPTLGVGAPPQVKILDPRLNTTNISEQRHLTAGRSTDRPPRGQQVVHQRWISGKCNM